MKFNERLKTLRPWLVITFGCVACALGYTMFIVPLGMMEGGVTGVGIILYHLTGLPIIGITSIVLTGIAFYFGTRYMGKGFGAKSIYATVLLNLLIDGFQHVGVPQVTDDVMLGAFYGGAIVGTGLGLIYQFGAATGGADALCQILYRLKGIPLGRTLLVIDIVILGASLFVVGAQKVMYSLLFIWIEIRAIDIVLNGIRASQSVLIITDRHEPMRSAIVNRLKRGATLFKGVGAYTGQERMAIRTVLSKKEVPELRRLVGEVDRDAFVVVEDVDMVYGEGFQTFPIEDTSKIVGK